MMVLLHLPFIDLKKKRERPGNWNKVTHLASRGYKTRWSGSAPHTLNSFILIKSQDKYFWQRNLSTESLENISGSRLWALGPDCRGPTCTGWCGPGGLDRTSILGDANAEGLHRYG